VPFTEIFPLVGNLVNLVWCGYWLPDKILAF